MKTVTTSVTTCPRCGLDHDEVVFRVLTRLTIYEDPA